MADKIRWGIISTANINDVLIEAINLSDRSELAAVASRSQEKGQAYAKEKGIAKAYAGYEALLADPDIDVVYISVPNTYHREWTVAAAQAGKHVLCEKPIVPTLAELDDIEAAAKANAVTVFEAFMYLHHPQSLKVREMVVSGQLGDIQLVNSWFAYYLPPEDKDNIRLLPDMAGGSFWDVGVYPNSLIITMINNGAPAEVWARQTKGETGVDVTLVAQLRFLNGAMAQLSSGFRTPFREGALIVGSKGLIKIDEPWKPGLSGDSSAIVFSDLEGNEEEIVFSPVSPYLSEVQAMEACVLDGAQPVVPLSLSRDFLRSILAIYQSAETGQPVKLG